MSMARLERRFPELARWLARSAPPVPLEWRAGPHPAMALQGVQLASRFDPRAEAELQARLVPRAARRATLYGLGQGELVRVLLAREELAALRVVVLSPGVLRAVLEHTPCEWLDDARLELVHPERAELEPPFAVAPPDLRLAADEGARLRDLVALELATPLLRRHQEARAEPLRARIAACEQRFGADRDVGELFGSRPGASLCVAAAGPTLARHYAELRARAHELVAVDAALGPLLSADVVPAFVLTQDPHEEGMRRLFAVTHPGLARSTLVYFPESPPAVLAAWPGARCVARSGSALHRGAPNPRGIRELFCSGSVLHPSVDLAVQLGARRVELFGADFALTGGQSHVTGSAWQFDWRQDAGSVWVLDGHGRRVPSLPNLIGYLRDFERYVARHPEVEFVTRSRESAAPRGVRIEEPREEPGAPRALQRGRGGAHDA